PHPLPVVPSWERLQPRALACEGRGRGQVKARGYSRSHNGTRVPRLYPARAPYNARPMRLVLQQRPDGHDAPRFVQLMLQPDLFGGWTLVRETGQMGGRSTVRREQFPDHPSALLALERARDQQLKRGFQLMFTQGTEAPKPG